MKTEERETGIGDRLPNRREFLAGVTALGLTGWAEQGIGWAIEAPGWSGLPARPEERPLDFHALANAFDAWVMDPAHGLNKRAKDGRQVFPSALEGEEDGGLTTYAPMALGKELRGEGLEGLATSLKGYFSEPYGLFLDGAGATLCEYWYLMNVTAMAYGLIQLRFGHDAEWLARVEKSATRLKDMAQQIHYDFNSQGYDFAKACGFHQPRHLPATGCRGRIQLRDVAGVEADWEGSLSGRSQDRHRSLSRLSLRTPGMRFQAEQWR